MTAIPNLNHIVLLGSTGQVGSYLKSLLGQLGQVHAPERASLDFKRPESIRNYLLRIAPRVVVNAAAYTAVDKAETDRDVAFTVNAIAPQALAEGADETGALLIHYSTDYVFNGCKIGPYLESDPVNPLNVYGATKADGERAIQQSGCNHLILRTSWVYSHVGSNFLLTMLRLASERKELRIVNDQVGAPTSSHSLAQATANIIRQYLSGTWASAMSGIYHVTDAGTTSWFGFAEEILRDAAQMWGSPVPRLIPIPTSEYPTPARRPLNSVLACDKLRSTFGITMPAWQLSMREVLLKVLRKRQGELEEKLATRRE